MTTTWLLDTATTVLALGAAVATPLGWRFRPAATLAVICIAGVLALVEVPVLIAVAASGLAAVCLRPSTRWRSRGECAHRAGGRCSAQWLLVALFASIVPSRGRGGRCSGRSPRWWSMQRRSTRWCHRYQGRTDDLGMPE